MIKKYNKPEIKSSRLTTSTILAGSYFRGAGVGEDIEYGGDDEEGIIDPSVKSNSFEWSNWE